MKTPLFDALDSYKNDRFIRMHMPGHKGRLPFPLSEAAAYDITEIYGADSLYESSGVIAEMERAHSKIYGSTASYLSAGGSTLCIQAMLSLAAKPGGKIIAARGVHTSAINTMAMLDLSPEWVYPEYGQDGLTGAVLPETVREALSRNPEASAVYITSPNYYGVISDIAGIAGVCAEFGAKLLVDNAHGSHLKFLPEPLHPIDLGVDMCCDSLHKTMPVLTGGALLHVKGEWPDVKSRMALFGSTSPSYLIMLSCDMLLSRLASGIGREIGAVCDGVRRVKVKVREHGYLIPAAATDPVRLTVGFRPLGYSGAEFGEYIRSRKIEPEYLSESYCVFLCGLETTADDLERLEDALLALPPGASAQALEPGMEVHRPEKAVSIRTALFSEQERIPVEKAEGRITAAAVAPCPPGIPVIVPGERLDKLSVAILKNCGIFHVNVIK